MVPNTLCTYIHMYIYGQVVANLSYIVNWGRGGGGGVGGRASAPFVPAIHGIYKSRMVDHILNVVKNSRSLFMINGHKWGHVLRSPLSLIHNGKQVCN